MKNGVVFQTKQKSTARLVLATMAMWMRQMPEEFQCRASDGNSPGKRPGSAGQRSPRGASPSYASYYNNSPQAQSAQGGYPNTPNRDYYNHVEADSGVKTPYQ